jgi:hypothetical protein
MDTLKESGAFEASTNTRSDATGEVLRLMVDEFWRLQRERVSERELGDAKAYLTGNFPLTIETPDAIATQVLNVLFYGLPIEQLDSFRQRVNAVSVDEVERVARYYLKPDRLSIVLVGNTAAFESQLRRVGFGTYETIDMGNLDLTAVDFKRPVRADGGGGAGGPGAARRQGAAGRAGMGQIPAVLRVSFQLRPLAAAEQDPAAQLVDKVIAAKGGLDTLRAIRSITAVTRAALTTPNGRVEAETTTYLQYPNRMRVETTLPAGTIVQTYDGSRAWVKDPSGTHEVPGRMIGDLEATFKRDTVAALLAAHDGSVHARLLPNAKDEAGTIRHAIELSGPGLEPMVLYVDPETYLVARQSYVAGRPGQPLIEELFTDYRTVDGLQIAFTAKVRQGGQSVLERRVIDIKINAPLNPALFQRPGS